MKIKILFTALIIITNIQLVFSTKYYISQNGNDENTGTTDSEAWQSLEKVNSFEFQPGDSVLFECGNIWRGQLQAQSGNESAVVYYGSYGSGPKPIISGSVNLSDEIYWINTSTNIWETPSYTLSEPELISNPSFDTDATNWTFHTQDDADATGNRTSLEYNSAPASFHISCISSGLNPWEIQFTTQNIQIIEGKTYQLSFYAKSSNEFNLNSIFLMQSVPPYELYSDASSNPIQIQTEWDQYIVFFTSNTSVDNAMINFVLGGIIPDNTDFFIDDISFKEIAYAAPITCDVGNIIFNNDMDFGVKKWTESELLTQGDFWYDTEHLIVKLYSETNPTLYYNNIECALTKNLVGYENKTHVEFENLAIKNGSAHGFGGGNTSNITIRSCDISYIGGGAIYITGYGNIRFGNGIEFWENAQNNIVEGCRIYQIYDAAITNQNAGNTAIQHNIIYRNNLISNSEWSFEHWNRPAESQTSEIYFINNTCLFAGDTWAKDQRDFDPSIRGSHITFFQTEAQTSDFYIYNNIFYESESAVLYCLRAQDLNLFSFKNNCWYQTITDTLVKIYYDENLPPYVNIVFNTTQFSDYQSTYDTELNSILENPMFVDEYENNFRISNSSPCIDSGFSGTPEMPVGDTDFEGNERILPGFGMPPSAIDIGCYEYDWHSSKVNIAKEISIEIFPNPFCDNLIIQADEIVKEIEIFDIYGRCVLNFSPNKSKINLDLSDFAIGIYMIKLSSETHKTSQRLIKSF